MLLGYGEQDGLEVTSGTKSGASHSRARIVAPGKLIYKLFLDVKLAVDERLGSRCLSLSRTTRADYFGLSCKIRRRGPFRGCSFHAEVSNATYVAKPDGSAELPRYRDASCLPLGG